MRLIGSLDDGTMKAQFATECDAVKHDPSAGASVTPSEAGSSTLTSCPTIPEEETLLPTPPPPVAEHNRARTMSRLQSGRPRNREDADDTCDLV